MLHRYSIYRIKLIGNHARHRRFLRIFLQLEKFSNNGNMLFGRKWPEWTLRRVKKRSSEETWVELVFKSKLASDREQFRYSVVFLEGHKRDLPSKYVHERESRVQIELAERKKEGNEPDANSFLQRRLLACGSLDRVRYITTDRCLATPQEQVLEYRS